MDGIGLWDGRDWIVGWTGLDCGMDKVGLCDEQCIGHHQYSIICHDVHTATLHSGFNSLLEEL
jgi:hypothetical protein